MLQLEMKTLNLNDDAVNADVRPPVTDDRRKKMKGGA